MPINPSIALGVRPMELQAPESPMNAYAKMMQMQNMQQEQSKNALLMRQAEKAEKQESEISNYLRNPSFKREGLLQFGTPGIAMAKALGDADAAKLTAKKTQGEIDAGSFKLNIDKANKAVSDISALSSKEEAEASILRHLNAGDIDQQKADMLLGTLNQQTDFRAWRRQMTMHALDAKDRLEAEKAHFADTGGAIVPVDKYTGLPINPGLKKVVSPDTAAKNATSRSNNEASIAAANVRAGDPNTTVANTQVDNAGNVTHFNKFGQIIGSKVMGAGKPSATYEKGVAQRKQLSTDIDSTIKELESATATGGLIEQSTGSGAGALYDMAAGFVGNAPEGAIAIGALKPIYDKVLKMVPRFEGPQGKADVVTYENAAGQLANPNVPKDIKLAAAKTILRLMKARKGQFGNKDMPEEASIQNPAVSAGTWKDL